jgi:hypothetical protein
MTTQSAWRKAHSAVRILLLALCPMLYAAGASAQDMTARDEGTIVGRFRELNCIGSFFACAVTNGRLSLTATPQTAAGVANTPAGNIAATDVQAALNELDGEKQGVLTNSAGLRAALSDETGTGAAVFAGGDIGAATATTPSADDNDTSVATTAYVQTELGQEYARTARGDANYTILTTDRLVAVTASLTAPRTFTLPAASAYPTGRVLTVVDEAGGVTSTNTLTVARAGSDTINGATSVVIKAANGGISIESDGSSKWTMTANVLTAAQTCGSNTFVTAYNADGTFTCTQPAFSNISGTAGVSQGGTGITSGTSGGVLAFTASGTIASSGALTANLPVIGGGAGVAPTVGTRSGNTTAYVTTTGTQTSGDCVKIDANGNHIANGSACGSGGSDLLSTLTSAEISITGATTATISRMHVASGTSADYTITLPACASNAGKFIGFRMAPIASLSKLVTLDANSTETIDGSLTRVMWAEESAILLCDGTNWFKIAGKSRPMMATMHLSANQTGVVTSTMTKVNLNSTDVDNTGLMANTGSNRIDIKRAATYDVSGTAVIELSGTASARNLTQLRKNDSQVGYNEASATAAGIGAPLARSVISWAVGDNVSLAGFHMKGSNASFFGGALSDGACQLTVIEIPQW